MSCERALSFDRSKTKNLWLPFMDGVQLFQGYRSTTRRSLSFSLSLRVLLWHVYKFLKNNCCMRLFSEFIQIQKRNPASIDKIVS